MVSSSFITCLVLSAPLTGQGFVIPQPNGGLSSSLSAAATTGDVLKDAGDNALSSVQWFGSLVSKSAGQSIDDTAAESEKDKSSIDGTGGSVYSRLATTIDLPEDKQKERQVWAALANLEKDMQFLDLVAGQRPQLSAAEATLLSLAVLSAASGPLLLGGKITEFLAPSAAAFSAAIGIGAEYTGKVAVADGKEVAASAIQCAAEAEGLLANAERAKAICPLCVGIGATSATLSLLVPVLFDTIGLRTNLQMMTEVYLFCPLLAVLSAAVAALALQDTRAFCSDAIGVGNRRFARSGNVGRTWLSAPELVDRKSVDAAQKWRSFTLSVLPAPLLGSLIPGALPTKTIIIAALAAAQSAYFLTLAESTLSRAQDAVALKARSAAVCDTYANQGTRSAAILPFTSALSSLCAAATAAIVELPFVEALATAGTGIGTLAEIITVSTFPALAALFAAAASVSKARCEVDAEAAKQAASTLALQYREEEEDPVLRPLRGVKELIILTYLNSVREPLRRFFRKLDLRRRWKVARKWVRHNQDDGDQMARV